MRCVSDQYQESYAVPHHSIALVRFVANPSVARDRNPAMRADAGQPFFVGRVVRKVIFVLFNPDAMGAENLGEPISEVSVGEIDKRQAARS